MVLGIGWLFTNFPNRFCKVTCVVVGTAVGVRVATPFVFRVCCDRAFDKIDHNNNNQLDINELQLAMYEVYNGLNKRFPGWTDPPDRKLVLEVLDKFDVDGDRQLNKDEFYEFACDFLQNHGEKLWQRITRSMAGTVGLLPAATPQLKAVAGIPSVIPDAMLAPALGTIAKAVQP
mmetsp:Transcript_18816/g.22553  ORF Transcript_18816/g.22553 Transcript_18816/m.22553 type:complete len:175 (-) Transcript_18816:18-542(-)|eukprot:CAMPEP_0197856662 /NCGR_PEP_ID=MMETSP1438-20131217/29002_1 /TAXON_ID=1461541 /ORGANISM="Pterosperma sp., Strain CCMP1384" /LENGTH=174 /DNA_ID=CAMNT_0043472193 /DNA_START=93 /DNA_END=617 /DNA_ORIENTATION=+